MCFDQPTPQAAPPPPNPPPAPEPVAETLRIGPSASTQRRQGGAAESRTGLTIKRSAAAPTGGSGVQV